jgi:DNA repair protein RadC
MRPREHYLLAGPDHHGDADLLALALGTGVAGRPARSIADDVLGRVGRTSSLVSVGARGLGTVPGVGLARGVRLHAALTLGWRAATACPEPVEPILTPSEAARWLGPRIGSEGQERLHVLFLSARRKPLVMRIMSIGSAECTVVAPREIVRAALLVDAAAFILAHNHPSGDPSPSTHDITTTRQVRRAAEAAGLSLDDHLVFGSPTRWTSMRECCWT